MIDDLRAEHWPDGRRIYADGIATGNATFETEVPTWKRRDDSHLTVHHLVALRDGQAVGWAAVSAVSDRCVYGGVVENGVDIEQEVQRQGVGRLLLERLIGSTEAAGISTIQTASVRRTTRASVCINASASTSSGAASGSASLPASGATCSCWNVAAASLADATARSDVRGPKAA